MSTWGSLLDGELLGEVQLANIDWRQRTATLGIGIMRRAQRGQGYGTDAARTLLRFGFEELDLTRVSATTAAYNLACQRLLDKCGFVREGCARQATYCAGQRWEQLHYGLLREELLARPHGSR